jgi:hypothetical protein
MFFGGNLVAMWYRPSLKWVGLLSLLSISKSLSSLCFYAISNFEPDNRLNVPILIENDYSYWAGTALSSFMSGYFISLLIVYIPTQVRKKYSNQTVLVKFLKYKQTETEKAGLAGLLASVVIVSGIASGLQLSRFYELIILNF